MKTRVFRVLVRVYTGFRIRVFVCTSRIDGIEKSISNTPGIPICISYENPENEPYGPVTIAVTHTRTTLTQRQRHKMQDLPYSRFGPTTSIRRPERSPIVPPKSIGISLHQILERGGHPGLVGLLGPGELDVGEVLVVQHVGLEERLEVRDGRPLQLRRRQLGHELEDGVQLARAHLTERRARLEVDGRRLLVDSLGTLLL